MNRIHFRCDLRRSCNFLSRGQVAAMDRALLQMCAIDDVLLDSTSSVVRFSA